MNIEITDRSAALSSALREYASKRIANVERLGAQIEKSEVIFRDEREELICEVILHPRRGDAFIAQDRARDGRAAVDGVAAKLEKQLRRHRDRLEALSRQPRPDKEAD